MCDDTVNNKAIEDNRLHPPCAVQDAERQTDNPQTYRSDIVHVDVGIEVSFD